MFQKFLSAKEPFEAQTKGVISNSIVQNWTIQALDCYKINCDCKKCPIKNGGYSFKCKMKEVVKILLKKYGKPNEKKIFEMAREEGLD